MIVLGLYGGADGRAAAVARDGKILAAINTSDPADGPSTDAPMQAIVTECLRVAGGLGERDVDAVVRVDSTITLEQAHASYLRTMTRGSLAALTVSREADSASASLVLMAEGAVARCQPVAGIDEASRAVDFVAEALGVSGSPGGIGHLELIAGRTRAVSDGRASVFRLDETNLICECDALTQLVENARTAAGRALNAVSPHVNVQRARRHLAEAFLTDLADACVGLGRTWQSSTGADRLMYAGNFVGSEAFRARMSRVTDSCEHAPVSSNVASALGAALSPFSQVEPQGSVALGPSFDEPEIKAVLESCRLNYVYEPTWDRLLTQVSTVLSSGALVAWFQGRCDFGLTSYGSRSILADPSVPFARENVNVFLRGLPVDSFTPVAEVVSAGAYRVIGYRAELASLLDAHAKRTGVGGLFHVGLPGETGPLAISPREAVRCTFGSAVDLLVIGRFLVSKDYWLLRGRNG